MLYLWLFAGLFSVVWVVSTLRILMQTDMWSWRHRANLALDIAIFGTVATYCVQQVMP